MVCRGISRGPPTEEPPNIVENAILIFSIKAMVFFVYRVYFIYFSQSVVGWILEIFKSGESETVGTPQYTSPVNHKERGRGDDLIRATRE